MQTIYSDYYPIVLYTDKYHFPNKWAYPKSKVPYSLFRYIIEGSAVFNLDEREFIVQKGDLFYIPMGTDLSCTAIEEIKFISTRFVGSVQLHGIDMLNNLWGIPYQHNFADMPEIELYFENMYQSAISSSTFKMLEMRGYLNLICACMAKVSSKANEDDLSIIEERKQMEALFDIKSIQRRAVKSSVSNNDPRVTMLLDYIISYPEKNITRDEMCKLTDTSESTLRRLFKQKTGKTIYEFVKDTKMTNAARRLLITNIPISDIAYDLGFESPSYFTKSFKEVFGLPPMEYRKMSHEA